MPERSRSERRRLTIRKERKLTMIVVTHDAEIAAKADRQIRLTGGKVS